MESGKKKKIRRFLRSTLEYKEFQKVETEEMASLATRGELVPDLPPPAANSYKSGPNLWAHCLRALDTGGTRLWSPTEEENRESTRAERICHLWPCPTADTTERVLTWKEMMENHISRNKYKNTKNGKYVGKCTKLPWAPGATWRHRQKWTFPGPRAAGPLSSMSSSCNCEK